MLEEVGRIYLKLSMLPADTGTGRKDILDSYMCKVWCQNAGMYWTDAGTRRKNIDLSLMLGYSAKTQEQEEKR